MPLIPLLRAAPIVGNYFRDDAAKEIYGNLLPGEPLAIAHDADNEHDDYAIAVLSGDTVIGYIPATVSACVFAHLSALAEAEVHVSVAGRTKDNKYVTMNLEVME